MCNRLTGGPSHVTCLQNDEQMGEGWSDFLALVLTAKPAEIDTTPRGIGNYLIWEDETGFGIRPTPYTTDLALNGIRYGTAQYFALAMPHGIGYAWATMLWEVYWNLDQGTGSTEPVRRHHQGQHARPAAGDGRHEDAAVQPGLRRRP